MNYEKEIISNILAKMPITDKHLSKFFESDSEVIEIEGGKFLFSIDTFGEEDYLDTTDPYLLGKNLATATITDIFASGGKLLFFSSSLTISSKWSREYISELSRGIGDIIKSCDAFFAGGDLGISDNWSFTGVAFGKTSKEISRRGCKPGDSIYVTGEIGSGNLNAAVSILKANKHSHGISNQEFCLHHRESEIISQFANSCIDTSDGFIKSLQIISEINDTGFETTSVPYLTDSVGFIINSELPKELLLMGECGEYELLFTVAEDKVIEFERIILDESLKIKNVGTICHKDTKKIVEDNYYIDFSDYEVHARNFGNNIDYITSLVNFIENNKYGFSGLIV